MTKVIIANYYKNYTYVCLFLYYPTLKCSGVLARRVL